MAFTITATIVKVGTSPLLQTPQLFTFPISKCFVLNSTLGGMGISGANSTIFYDKQFYYASDSVTSLRTQIQAAGLSLVGMEEMATSGLTYAWATDAVASGSGGSGSVAVPDGSVYKYNNDGVLEPTTVLPGTYDSDAQAYITAVSALGYISDKAKAAVNTFCLNAKANGYWSKLLDVHLYRGKSIAEMLIKLKAFPSSGNLGNNGFTNLDILKNKGLKGNASSFLIPNINYNQLTSGLGGLSLYLSDPYIVTAGEFVMGAGNASSPQMQIQIDQTNGIGGRWGATAQVNTGIPAIAAGFYHVERSSATLLKLYANGITARQDTTSISLATRNQLMYLFAANGATPTAATLAFTAFDDGTFTDAQAALFANDVRDLMKGINVIIPQPNELQTIIGLGQSLMKGYSSTAITTTPLFNSLTKGDGVMSDSNNDNPSSLSTQLQSVLKPLAESVVETPCSGFAAWLGAKFRANYPYLLPDKYDPLMLNYGVNGASYSQLAKGTRPYANSLDALTNAKNVAAFYRTGNVVVPGLICVHGEADVYNVSYQANVEQWQSDYENDIKAITGQSGDVPIFHSQASSWASGTANAPYGLYSAFKGNPQKTILVCPKYFLPHFTDGLHLTATSYRRLGEYYAKAWYQFFVLRQQYNPLRPAKFVRSGTNIDITFTGNVGNLVFDTTNVTDPGTLKGFEFVDPGNGGTTITSVTITGSNTIRLVLSAAPTGATLVRYAYTSPGIGGPTTGPRGCLRDSDTTPSYFVPAENLYNWCIHFNEICP